MNETTASIVGGEIGRQVIERFYPALVPVAENVEVEDSPNLSRPPFDFRAEMNITRQRVDELLAAGQIERSRNVHGTTSATVCCQRLQHSQTESGLLRILRCIR